MRRRKTPGLFGTDSIASSFKKTSADTFQHVTTLHTGETALNDLYEVSRQARHRHLRRVDLTSQRFSLHRSATPWLDLFHQDAAFFPPAGYSEALAKQRNEPPDVDP